MYDHKYTTYIEDESFAQIRIPHEHLTERQNSTSECIIIVLYNYNQYSNCIYSSCVDLLSFSKTSGKQIAELKYSARAFFSYLESKHSVSRTYLLQLNYKGYEYDN